MLTQEDDVEIQALAKREWSISAFSRRVEDIPVVSAPRLFADLSSFGGRDGDAADHVKAELIDPLHSGESIGEDDASG